MIHPSAIPRPRRGLSADALVDTLRRRFETVADGRRQASCNYSMADTLLSAYAMLATKAPSMLAFEDRLRELRIEKPFKIEKVPSDTQMREILEGIDIEPLNEAFADLFWEPQRSQKLKKWPGRLHGNLRAENHFFHVGVVPASGQAFVFDPALGSLLLF